MSVSIVSSRFLVAMTAVVLMVLGVGVFQGEAQAITATQLSNSIPDAKNNFVAHETECYNQLAIERAKNQSARNAVSASQPYQYNNWISLRNQPSQKTTNFLPAGNISLQLQFNQSLFLCAILANNATGTASINPAYRVTNNAYPNDRSIVRGGSTPNRADLTRKDARITSTEISAGGGSLSNVVGSQRNINVQDSSRYSFASTIPFTYTANLQKTTTIEIKVSFVEIRSYGQIISCDHVSANGSTSRYEISNSGTNGRTMTQIFNANMTSARCNRVITKTDKINVRVTPPPVWTTSGTTTVNQTVAAPGDTIRWTHTLTNNGPDRTTKAVFSRVARSGFTNNTEYQGATTATNRAAGTMRTIATTHSVTAADVGKTLCQRLRWNPISSTSNGTSNATNRCVTIRAAWDLSVTSQNSNQSATPGVFGVYPYAAPRMVDAGDGVIFRHTATNNGIRTSAGFDRWAGRSRFVNTSATWVLLGTRTTGNTVNTGATRTWNSPLYTARADTLGRILCERHSVQGRSSSSAAALASTGSCITVRENYKLTPAIPLLSRTATPGDPINPFTPTVTNRMDVPVKTTATLTGKAWQVVRFKLGSTSSIPSAGQGVGSPCSYIGGKAGLGCTPVANGTKVFAVNNNLLDAISGQKIPDDLQLGEKICFMVAVRPHSSATPADQWGYSDSVCITVGKAPMVQVWGGDVRAGLIRTSTSGVESATYGSWGEYGVFARGVNDDMASGSGLIGGKSAVPSSDYHRLTFANKTPAGVASYGNYSFADAAKLIPQFTSLAQTGTLPTSVNIGDRSTAAINVFRPTTNITLNASTLAAGTTTIINASGRTVTITGDQKYVDGALSSTGQIPQLIIIASNINIHGSVERVDAWLLVSGWIDTCGNISPAGAMPGSGSTLKADVCANQLVVNGPVTTRQLVLKRTGGAEVGPGRDTPAELFKLRPDAFMWLHHFSGRQAQAWTTGVNELPARY